MSQIFFSQTFMKLDIYCTYFCKVFIFSFIFASITPESVKNQSNVFSDIFLKTGIQPNIYNFL